jgi:hypothetical protein
MRPFAASFILGACLTLPLIAQAQSSNWFGASDGAVIQVLNEKEQKAKNKACGPNHVFVKELGCIKREKAEKLKEKSKQPPEKTTKTSCSMISLDEKVLADLKNACAAQHPGADFNCAGFETSRRCCCYYQE